MGRNSATLTQFRGLTCWHSSKCYSHYYVSHTKQSVKQEVTTSSFCLSDSFVALNGKEDTTVII
jgi:hypothetical protein